MVDSLKCFDADALDKVVEGRLWAMFASLPDNLAATKLFLQWLGERLVHMLLFGGGCFGHGLSLTVNHAIVAMNLVNPQYSLACTIKMASNSTQFSEASLLQYRSRNIFRGVPSPALDARANCTGLVLKCTLERGVDKQFVGGGSRRANVDTRGQ